MARTIFERYGGFANVSRVVSTFYDKVLESPGLTGYFAETDMRRLIDHQTKFIASLMGGPASYSDDELLRIHARMDITNGAFDEVASLLKETLEDFDFDPADIDAVFRSFQSKRQYIVARA